MSKPKAKTHITQEHRAAYDALRDPKYTNFALMSATVNGEPTAVIVSINESHSEEGPTVMHLQPLFVAVTPGMDLRDHDGRRPASTMTDGFKGVEPLGLQGPRSAALAELIAKINAIAASKPCTDDD